MTALFVLDRDRLLGLAEERRGAYAAARPFPHTVIDGFLPCPVLDAVLDEFPAPGDIEWWAFNDARERKLGTFDDRAMGPVTRQVLGQLNSATAIDFLQRLTGIPGLVPDPHLLGGGLHQIETGGFLKVHADFNVHPTTGLERRLNLLVYLNKGWKPEYGGALELWDPDMSAPTEVIEPLFNRCVIFTTSDRSFHGHPDPLECPTTITRKSLALYYYSAPRMVDGRITEHNTLWRHGPGEDLPAPGGDPEAGPGTRSRFPSLRRTAERWLPPAVADAIRSRQAARAGRSAIR